MPARTVPLAALRWTFLRFGDLQRAAFEFMRMELLDCTNCIWCRHFDESEAARFTGLLVDDQRHPLHLAMRGEELSNRHTRSSIGQIAHEDLGHCLVPA